MNFFLKQLLIVKYNFYNICILFYILNGKDFEKIN